MKTSSILILLLTLSAAYGLRCYQCNNSDPKSCTNITECVPLLDMRCSIFEFNGLVTKGCRLNNQCIGPVKCCTGDLCNGAASTGSSVLLLLVSAAITSVFL